MRGQVEQARGMVAFAETNQANTVIRAPVTGTILERAVEKGEFVTTSFVGDRGAKGYVVSMADLNDLEVELDINQNDFAKLGPRQKGIVTTDAYPDRKYDGVIEEISPEANRAKGHRAGEGEGAGAGRVPAPGDECQRGLRRGSEAGRGAASRTVVVVPASAVRDNAVFVLLDGKAVRRAVKIGGTNSQGVRVEEGLIGGEDLIVNPPADLKDGTRVKRKA